MNSYLDLTRIHDIADAYRGALRTRGLAIGGLVTDLTESGAYVETAQFISGCSEDPDHYRARAWRHHPGTIVDPDCIVSVIPGGAFVQSWVWIPSSEI